MEPGLYGPVNKTKHFRKHWASGPCCFLSPDHHVGSESASHSSNMSRQDELIVGEQDLKEMRLDQGVVADEPNVREIRSALRQGHVLRERLLAVLHAPHSQVTLEVPLKPANSCLVQVQVENLFLGGAFLFSPVNALPDRDRLNMEVGSALRIPARVRIKRRKHLGPNAGANTHNV